MIWDISIVAATVVFMASDQELLFYKFIMKSVIELSSGGWLLIETPNHSTFRHCGNCCKWLLNGYGIVSRQVDYFYCFRGMVSLQACLFIIENA